LSAPLLYGGTKRSSFLIKVDGYRVTCQLSDIVNSPQIRIQRGVPYAVSPSADVRGCGAAAHGGRCQCGVSSSALDADPLFWPVAPAHIASSSNHAICSHSKHLFDAPLPEKRFPRQVVEAGGRSTAEEVALTLGMAIDECRATLFAATPLCAGYRMRSFRNDR